MPTLIGAIEILPEKHGHQLYRRISEEYQPYCGWCRAVFAERLWHSNIDSAMEALRYHLVTEHGVGDVGNPHV